MKSLRPETRVLGVIAGAVAMLGILVVVIVATAGTAGAVIPPAVIVDTAIPTPTALGGTAADRAGSPAPSPATTGSVAAPVAPWMLQAVSGPAADGPAVAPLLGLQPGPNQPPRSSTPSPSPSARPSPTPQTTPEPQVDVAPTASPVETASPTESSTATGTPVPTATPAPDGATPTPDGASPTSTPEPTGD